MLVFFSAFWAFALDDERDGVGGEASREFETWYMDVLHAEGTLARLAIEVDVPIVVVALSVFLAELVVEDASSVFEGMYHIVFQEKGEHSEDARLIHRHHQPLDVAEAQRCACPRQRFHHEDAVGGGLNAFRF